MIRYAGIINNDVVNGVDVCVSYWCQGCPHKCEGCHNPETWSFRDGFEAEENEMIERVIELIGKNGIQRNLSFLGGEPLCFENVDFVCDLICKVKERYPTIKIIVWTGYDYESIKKRIRTVDGVQYSALLDNIDILIDGKYDESCRDITLPLRGSLNQRVIDVKRTRQSGLQGEVVLWKQKD